MYYYCHFPWCLSHIFSHSQTSTNPLLKLCVFTIMHTFLSSNSFYCLIKRIITLLNTLIKVLILPVMFLMSVQRCHIIGLISHWYHSHFRTWNLNGCNLYQLPTPARSLWSEHDTIFPPVKTVNIIHKVKHTNNKRTKNKKSYQLEIDHLEIISIQHMSIPNIW